MTAATNRQSSPASSAYLPISRSYGDSNDGAAGSAVISGSSAGDRCAATWSSSMYQPSTITDQCPGCDARATGLGGGTTAAAAGAAMGAGRRSAASPPTLSAAAAA